MYIGIDAHIDPHKVLIITGVLGSYRNPTPTVDAHMLIVPLNLLIITDVLGSPRNDTPYKSSSETVGR